MPVARCQFIKQGRFLWCTYHRMLVEDGFNVIDGERTSTRHIVVD